MGEDADASRRHGVKEIPEHAPEQRAHEGCRLLVGAAYGDVRGVEQELVEVPPRFLSPETRENCGERAPDDGRVLDRPQSRAGLRRAPRQHRASLRRIGSLASRRCNGLRGSILESFEREPSLAPSFLE